MRLLPWQRVFSLRTLSIRMLLTAFRTLHAAPIGPHPVGRMKQREQGIQTPADERCNLCHESITNIAQLSGNMILVDQHG